MTMILIAALIAATVIGFSMYSLNWRNAVKTALIIFVVEGALRKWVLPQASDLIYFLKDLIILVAYFKYYQSSESKYPFKATFLNITLLTFLVWGIAQVFTPGLGSPIIGLFGLKGYLFYTPLMWMLPNLFRSQEELHKFLRNYLLLLIPVALLAIAQFASPINSPINVYAGGKDVTATVGGNARVTGTFPYIAGYSVYLSYCFSILIPLLSLHQAKMWRWLTLLELLLLVGTSFMTGARGLLIFEVLFLGGYFLLLWLTKPSMAASQIKPLFFPIFLTLALIPNLFSEAIAKFTLRATTSSDSATFLDRTFSVFGEPAVATQFKGLLDSYGIGATHQAVFALRSILQIVPGELPPASEGDMGRTVLEVGMFGFILWYGLRLILIFGLFKVFWQLKTPFLRSLALASFLFQSINFTAQLASNNTYAIYYWLFSGFIFLLPELEYRQINSHQKLKIYVSNKDINISSN